MTIGQETQLQTLIPAYPPRVGEPKWKQEDYVRDPEENRAAKTNLMDHSMDLDPTPPPDPYRLQAIVDALNREGV